MKSIRQLPQTKLRNFEFRVYRLLQKAGLKDERVLVACSGGRDSVALAGCLARIGPRLGFEVALGHVHHGDSGVKKVKTARAQALRSVQELALRLGVQFVSTKRDERTELVSENDLREFRLKSLAKMREEGEFDRVAFAHHSDDLFETRLIRLIRGTGPQGLEAMREISEKILRPFLSLSRQEIEAYVQSTGLSWVDDPTNDDAGPLRNWLRHEWLPALELKRPGSATAMARSLASLVDACGPASQGRLESEALSTALIESVDGAIEGIDRKRYLQLGIVERRREIAAYLLKLGARDFSSAHVDEIRKRIEISRKRISFQLLNLHWQINAERICAHLVPFGET